MKRFGLIGHPISHSLSPALFKAAYDGRYTYDLIEGEDFNESYRKFVEEYTAINVTAPFKELACSRANELSDECRIVGAANILKKGTDGNMIHAYNSDIAGITEALKSAGLTYDITKKALVIGCGGAAMAATYAVWADLGYETIVLNRNLEKAKKFTEKMSASKICSSRLSADSLNGFEKYFRDADVIIYTLPIAIPTLNNLSRCAIRGGRFWERKKNKIILEANYKSPAFTSGITKKLFRINPQITYISGKEWLLHQAVGAYKSFTGEEPNIDAMRKVL